LTHTWILKKEWSQKMNRKEKDKLDEMATQLTGIEPIKDYEYQRLTYLKRIKGKSYQERKEVFKAKKRII